MPARAQPAPVAARYERKILAARLGWIFSKLVSLGTILISTPWLMAYLGPARFGLWMTLTSLSILLSASDLGIGNGLTTMLAKASGRDDPAEQRMLVSNSLVAMGGLALGLGGLYALAMPWLDWAALFGGLPPALAVQANGAAHVFVLLSLANIPAMLGQRMFSGLQMGLHNGLCASLASLAGLGGLVWAMQLGAGLEGLLAGFMLPPLLVNVAGTLVAMASLTPRWQFRRADLGRAQQAALYRNGLRFLGIFLIYAISFASDAVLIARALGPEAVAAYGVADRLYQLIAVFLSMANGPLWPAYSAAVARGDGAWVGRRFARSLVENLVFAALAGGVLLAAGPWVFGAWVGAAHVPPLAMAGAILLRRVAEALYSACSMLLNALDAARFQLGWGAAMAAASVGLRLWLFADLGLYANPAGVVLATLVFGLLPFFIALRPMLRSIDGAAHG